MSLFKRALSGLANTKEKIRKTFNKISLKNNLSIEEIDNLFSLEKIKLSIDKIYEKLELC